MVGCAYEDYIQLVAGKVTFDDLQNRIAIKVRHLTLVQRTINCTTRYLLWKAVEHAGYAVRIRKLSIGA